MSDSEHLNKWRKISAAVKRVASPEVFAVVSVDSSGAVHWGGYFGGRDNVSARRALLNHLGTIQGDLRDYMKKYDGGDR
jgi:hypothetical protein